MALMDIFAEVVDEYSRATSEFGSFNSAHEGLGIIWEEFEELKTEVFKKAEARDVERLRTEATHLATMAIRFITDICERS